MTRTRGDEVYSETHPETLIGMNTLLHNAFPALKLKDNKYTYSSAIK